MYAVVYFFELSYFSVACFAERTFAAVLFAAAVGFLGVSFAVGGGFLSCATDTTGLRNAGFSGKSAGRHVHRFIGVKQ